MPTWVEAEQPKRPLLLEVDFFGRSKGQRRHPGDGGVGTGGPPRTLRHL